MTQKDAADFKQINRYLDNIQQAPINFYWYTLDGTVCGVNQRCSSIFNKTNSYALVGADLKNIVGEDAFKDILKINQRVVETKVPVTGEEIYLADDGTSQHYLTTKIPLLDDNGEVIGILGMSMDLTDKIFEQIKASIKEIPKLVKSTGKLDESARYRYIKGIYFTKREAETLLHLSKGHSSMKALAQIMGISPRTVESHLDHIKQKIGVTYQNEILKFLET